MFEPLSLNKVRASKFILGENNYLSSVQFRIISPDARTGWAFQLDENNINDGRENNKVFCSLWAHAIKVMEESHRHKLYIRPQ